MAKTYPKPDPQVPPLEEVVSQELIDKLSACLGEPFPISETGCLDSLLRQYYIDKHLIDGRPPGRNVEAALETIRECALMLSNTLKELDYLSRGCLLAAAVELGTDGATVYPRLNQLQQEDESLTEWSQHSLKQVKLRKTRGRRKEHALPWLIAGLAQLFERIGKTPKRAAWDARIECSYGPFLDFCGITV